MLPVYQMKKCSRYIEKWKWGWETSYSIVAEKQVNSRSKICGWLKCCLYGQCHLEWWLSWIFHQPFTWSYSGWVKSSKENLCNVSKPLREAFFTFYCVYRDFIISFRWECAIVFFILNCHSKVLCVVNCHFIYNGRLGWVYAVWFRYFSLAAVNYAHCWCNFWLCIDSCS